MMKAWVYYPKEKEIRLTERAIPVAGAGQVVVKLKAASLNHRDVYLSKGWRAMDGYNPFVVGSDGAGTVHQVGDGVESWNIGDEVIVNPGVSTTSVLGGPLDGTLAEYVVISQDLLVKKPDYLTFEEAAALPLALGTAWWALQKGQMKPGETVYLQGIGGGVALFALQLAVAKNARVIVSSGSEAKIARAVELGAVAGLNYHSETFVEEMKTLTDGEGIHLAVDSGGKDTVRNTILSLAYRGRVVLVGNTSGGGDFPLMDLWQKEGSLHTISIFDQEAFADAIDFYTEHQLVPEVSKVYAFDETMDALTALDKAQQFGKLVIQI